MIRFIKCSTKLGSHSLSRILHELRVAADCFVPFPVSLLTILRAVRSLEALAAFVESGVGRATVNAGGFHVDKVYN